MAKGRWPRSRLVCWPRSGPKISPRSGLINKSVSWPVWQNKSGSWPQDEQPTSTRHWGMQSGGCSPEPRGPPAGATQRVPSEPRGPPPAALGGSARRPSDPLRAPRGSLSDHPLSLRQPSESSKTGPHLYFQGPLFGSKKREAASVARLLRERLPHLSGV